MPDRQVTNWYECPKCGPVDPVRFPVRMSLRVSSFEPEWELICPKCAAKVHVESGKD